MALKRKTNEHHGTCKRSRTHEVDAASGASTVSSGPASSAAVERPDFRPLTRAMHLSLTVGPAEEEHFGRWLWTMRRQVQWLGVTCELWKHKRLAIGLDGASGGFQGLVNDRDVVYVKGEGLLWVKEFCGTRHMETRHGVAARVPRCLMMNADFYPAYLLVSQKGRFAHALVHIQQAWRTKQFRRALMALRLLPPEVCIPEILLPIAHFCSARPHRNGIRYPVVGFDNVTGEPHRHFFEPKLLRGT